MSDGEMAGEWKGLEIEKREQNGWAHLALCASLTTQVS